MSVIANNLANLSTTGYRAEGLLFSEFIQGVDAPHPSLSMTDAGVHRTDFSQAPFRQTGGTFDLAIEGPGFFQIETPEGNRLTRAGAFTPNQEGELVSPDGHRLLDAGGSPVFVPPDAASIQIATDGTMSADGNPVAQIGAVMPEDPGSLLRGPSATFKTDGDVIEAENATIHQGFIESSNVNAILEVARMIEVQRRYEAVKSFLDKEDERVGNVVQTLSR
jgi:flagellar basal-body rod protein FlgF